MTNSRYYNPEWGRFLNADGILSDSILGKNLYAYCENNPVNYYDPDGESVIAITGLFIGIYLLASATTNIDTSILNEIQLPELNNPFAVGTFVNNAPMSYNKPGCGFYPRRSTNIKNTDLVSNVVSGEKSVFSTQITNLEERGYIENTFYINEFIGNNIISDSFAEETGKTCLLAEHTKNKRKSNWDKHTARRSGRMNTKNRQHPGWRQKPSRK